MANCCTLYFLSTLSCQLAECLSENELAALSADLSTLGSMLATILAHRELCQPQGSAEFPVTTSSPGSSKTDNSAKPADSAKTAQQITIV